MSKKLNTKRQCTFISYSLRLWMQHTYSPKHIAVINENVALISYLRTAPKIILPLFVFVEFNLKWYVESQVFLYLYMPNSAGFQNDSVV